MERELFTGDILQLQRLTEEQARHFESLWDEETKAGRLIPECCVYAVEGKNGNWKLLHQRQCCIFATDETIGDAISNYQNFKNLIFQIEKEGRAWW